LNIEARFTDNSSENAGTFHQEGAAVSVKIGEKEYQLKYTL
jgi:heparan-sulfate lyase